MLSFVTIKECFTWKPFVAIGAKNCSRFYHLTTSWAHTQLFHHIWPKTKAFQILKPNLLRHYLLHIVHGINDPFIAFVASIKMLTSLCLPSSKQSLFLGNSLVDLACGADVSIGHIAIEDEPITAAVCYNFVFGRSVFRHSHHSFPADPSRLPTYAGNLD